MAEKKSTRKPTKGKPAKRKEPPEERDSLGIRRKDYPIVGAVAVLALNVWAFNQDATTMTFRLLAIGVDFVIAYVLYRRYLAQYMPKRGQPTETTKASPKAATEMVDDKRGLFGIRTRHYPLLAGAVLLLINVSAFRSGPVWFIALAVIMDVVALYLVYRKYGLPWRRGE